MSFWQELSDKVKQNKLGTNITVQSLGKIKGARIQEFVVVKPAFYFGQIYTLSLDYMRFVEDLLSVSPADKAGVVKGLLLVREAASSLLSAVKAVAAPLEGLVLELDDLYSQATGRDEEEEAGDEDMKDEFAAEEAALAEKLEGFLRGSGNTPQVSQNLSKSMAGLYRECVHFAEAVSELLNSPDGDLEALLGVVLDIQYGLEWQMRFLVEDEVSSEQGAALSYAPGMLTWSGLALSELAPMLPEGKELLIH